MEAYFYYGSRVIARYEPKDRVTLRPCMEPLVGQIFEWEWVGTGDDDEPYPGQSRWLIVPDSCNIPRECFRWAPREDLTIISYGHVGAGIAPAAGTN